MVEVPLEIEAELPRDFEGSAQLASSGLPRRVRMRAPKDSLKLSTAYRTDQLAGDIVRTAMRGTVNDIMRVQDAVMKFIRAVRERRQDGATLVVSSNGRGKIDIAEHVPAPRVASPPAAAARSPGRGRAPRGRSRGRAFARRPFPRSGGPDRGPGAKLSHGAHLPQAFPSARRGSGPLSCSPAAGHGHRGLCRGFADGAAGPGNRGCRESARGDGARRSSGGARGGRRDP